MTVFRIVDDPAPAPVDDRPAVWLAGGLAVPAWVADWIDAHPDDDEARRSPGRGRLDA